MRINIKPRTEITIDIAKITGMLLKSGALVPPSASIAKPIINHFFCQFDE